MKIFEELIFDQTVRSTTEVLSRPEFDELLGKADEIVYEVEVEESSGSAPTVSFRHHSSNSGKGFVAQSLLINAADISTNALPYRNVVAQTTVIGGRGRVGITLGGTTPTARVRVWACGRTK